MIPGKLITLLNQWFSSQKITFTNSDQKPTPIIEVGTCENPRKWSQNDENSRRVYM